MRFFEVGYKMKKYLISCLIIILSCIATTSAEANKVSVPNGTIEYFRLGQGKPMVLVAGYFTNVRSWDKVFLQALAQKHEVIVFDNRNVGNSLIASQKYTTDALAEDIHHLLEALHLSHVDLLGISMGGMIAQQFAVNYPKSVDHLILMNTFAPGLSPIYPNKEVKRALRNPPQTKIGQFVWVLQYMFPSFDRTRMFFTFPMHRFKPADPTYKDLTQSKTLTLQQQDLIQGWIKNTVALQRLKRLSMPVLLLSGGADAVIAYANMDLLKKLIPHAQLKRWEGGGHAMMYQYPEEIAEVIDTWLD